MNDKSISSASGAPVADTIGGKEFTFYPLKLKHLGQLEQWMKQEPLRNAREVIREFQGSSKGDEKLKSLILEKAYEESSRLKLGGEGSESYLGSIRGIHQVVWHSLRQGDSAFVVEMVEDLLSDVASIERIGKMVMELSGLGGEAEVPFPQPSTSN